jgi:ubiquinone/menaquinone biosynthesis C-methylase UbiE
MSPNGLGRGEPTVGIWNREDSLAKVNGDHHQQEVQQEWGGAAPYWKKWNEKFVAQTQAGTNLVVVSAQLQPGMRVLDLASGTGEPALTVAQAVGPRGRVVATDLTLGMLQTARENAETRGLGNLLCAASHAESLPFIPAAFERVTCRFGLMFFVDVEKALAEVRRVLKPAGQISFLVWGPFDENPWFSAPLRPFLRHVQVPDPQPDAPGPFRFADENRLTSVLRAAGFRNVCTATHRVPWPWPGSPEEAWQAKQEISAPFKKLIAALPRDKEREVQQEVLAGIARLKKGNQIEFGATVISATAVA